MKTTEFLKETTERYESSNIYKVRPRIRCKDGFEMSIQASEYHHCSPRINMDSGNYCEVEIGFPSEEEPLFMEYAEDESNPTRTVYGYVPVEFVDEVIEKHGGLIEIMRKVPK